MKEAARMVALGATLHAAACMTQRVTCPSLPQPPYQMQQELPSCHEKHASAQSKDDQIGIIEHLKRTVDNTLDWLKGDVEEHP